MTMSRSLQTSATVDAVFAPAFSRSAGFSRRSIENEQVVPAAKEPLTHALAHAAQTNQTQPS